MVGKICKKRKVLSLEWKSEGVMGDESGESMKLVEEMPLKEMGEAELERLVKTLTAIGAQDTYSKCEFKLIASCSNYYHI